MQLIKFHQMSERFLIEFVSAKVQIRNADKILIGTFKDDSGIFDRVQRWDYGMTKVSHKSETKQRFFKLKCAIPTTPSTVQKMKGAKWFLCLENDGVVIVKFHTMIGTTDYLIAELKSTKFDFRIDLNHRTYLTATQDIVF